ncbi:MAG TPA: diadenylate cyclase, partial [Thermodesulfobacteriota bacterium]|nr:diadenylate cyclase [Thermodesulfobacteriota bacterium]
PEIATLVHTATDLAKEKIGALIVLRGKDMIIRHLSGGIELNGKVSEALLKSIFDPHSIGHDGAVIIERGKLTRFAAKLPLTKDLYNIGNVGTRHAAAVGLSELTDAMCIVVSEERGAVSIARRGKLSHIHGPEKLSLELENFYREINPSPRKSMFAELSKKNSREKIIAVSLAVALWFVLVDGSKSAYRTITIPVEYSILPSHLTVTEIDPAQVDVSLSGPQRAFYFLSKKKVKVFLKLWNLHEGTYQARISKSDLSLPKNLVVENIEPPAIRVVVKSEKNL